MCGYVYVSSRDKKIKPIDPQIMRHRGPDFSKEIDLGWCRFRHWRLSIQDLTSRSNQPYSDGQDYLLYNGEIYDYRDVGARSFLKTFSSDTQLLFQSLKNETFDLIKNESGFFSFVFIKELKKQFLSARDFFGKKPLYYYFDDDLLIIASEDRAVRDTALDYGKTVVINKLSIVHYIRYKDLHFGKTFYDGVLELAPGTTLEFDFGSWSLSESRSWEDYYFSKPFYKPDKLEHPTPNNTPTQLKQRITSAIEKRFRADVPVQLALSGGVDSTLVALVAKHTKKYFDRALTVSSSSRPSELIKSTLLCEKFQLAQKVIDFDALDVLDLLRKAIYAQGGPLSHPHALAVFAITQETKNRGKVLVTGEGADELMFGYEHYKNDNSTFAFREHIDLFAHFDINNVDQANSIKDIEWNKYLKNNDVRDLDVKTHLLSLLRRNDRMSMQNSVELRSAYLDFELFKFVADHQQKGSLKKGKTTLVEIIKDFHQDYEVDPEKIGFYVPFDHWYNKNKTKNALVKKYITVALDFLNVNLNWKLKENVKVKEKFAWALINIGLFLELEEEEL